MSYEKHRGSSAPGPFDTDSDGRVPDIDASLRSVEAITPGLIATGYAKDSQRNAQVANHLPGGDRIYNATVVHALSSLGWYKLQLGNMQGTVGGCMLSETSCSPLGIRDAAMIPPNSKVLVYKPAGLNYAFIMGVIPPALRSGLLPNPDWLCQGGQSGYKRDQVHQYILKNLYASGGVIDFSAQRPIDGTSLEWGKISSTGIRISLTDFEAQLAVHEQCGIFLNSFDGYTRLAGCAMDIESLVHAESARDDEGEARHVTSIATYSWEGLGLYLPGTTFTETNSDLDVQMNLPVAKIELPAAGRDVKPIYRWEEHGGYLGQGHVRALALPNQSSNSAYRRYSDTQPDEGLFCETVGIDGAYGLRSAKSIYIGRRTKIVIPREITIPEDGATGDDAQAGNYKFSSYFGTAEEHKIGEIAVTGTLKSMRRIAAVEDLIAFGVNWRTLHPFYYHKGDYSTAQESAQKDNFSTVQDLLDFTALETDPFLSDPEPVILKIDHRYYDAAYFQRESFLYFTDDGGIELCDGFGSEIRMGGGSIMLGAPGDVQLCPGRDLVAMAWQIILRAKQAADLSVTAGDVRIKADNGIYAMAGNSGQGGILLESKAQGITQDYIGNVGEDVISSGVIIRAPQSLFAAYSGEIYLRTGQADLGGGDIILDAGKGTNNIQLYAQEINAYISSDFTIYVGPVDETSNVNQVYTFSANACIIDTALLLGGTLIGYQGANGSAGIVIDGSISATQDLIVAGVIADGPGGFVGQAPNGFQNTIQADTNSVATQVATIKTEGTTKHQDDIVQSLYQKQQIGNDDVVPSIEFSFRDVKDNSQYMTDKLQWIERRWEQMARLGTGVGGIAWQETSVLYQGEKTYPWPGRQKWTEDTVFLQLESLTMFDTTLACSKDRPGPYTQPALSDWTTVTMESGYKLIR